MEIRDVIHGSIEIYKHELPILDSRHFQRLRQIRQLGFAEYSFPGATHNRYIHSLGAMHTATLAFDSIFSRFPRKKELNHYREILRVAALLHDIGHGPLSHSIEFAMPNVMTLKIPGKMSGDSLSSCYTQKSRNATHEDYTLKILIDSSLTLEIEKLGRNFGFKPHHLASLLDENYPMEDDFFYTALEGKKICLLPLLHQLVSSEMDADRMDYLRRDSLHAGVSYGHFDFYWLLKNITYHLQDGNCYLALQNRALYAFEDFLISRFHMFLMVYFHYQSVVFDEMLSQYFQTQDCDYVLPSDVEEYISHNDSYLYTHLANSGNEWAKRIIQRKPYRMLIELHSGIPSTKTAFLEHHREISRITRDLKHKNIQFILKTSTSEITKYYKKRSYPIFIKYDDQYHAPSFIRLEQCTDLFKRYHENRSITRIYVSPEQHSMAKKK